MTISPNPARPSVPLKAKRVKEKQEYYGKRKEEIKKFKEEKPRLLSVDPPHVLSTTDYARSLGDVRFSGPGRGRVYYYYY